MPVTESILIAAICVFAARTHQRMLHELHMLQLNSYRPRRHFRWLSLNTSAYLRPREILPLICSTTIPFSQSLGLLCWGGSFAVLFAFDPKGGAKKKLELTARAKRLHIVNVALTIALAVGFWQLVRPNLTYFAAALSITSLFIFLVPLLGSIVTAPVESIIGRWYVRDARKRLRQSPHLTSIGITGSYGKTSTKFILAAILSEEKNCLATPASFNTPMGVTKTIRTMLGPLHEVFLVEMGAREPGDIEEIAALVQPRIGVITAIGDQHLETFGSRESIAKTKFELLASLPSTGFACLNGDDDRIVRQAQFVTHVRKVFYGIDGSALDYKAEDLKTDASGTTFRVTPPRGQRLNIRSHLLGRHNVLNIMAAVAVAQELGVAPNHIESGIRKVKPMPHRLDLKKIPGSYTIIDDAYSSNPVGARSALSVLSEISGAKKIIITPGMVELGHKEADHNFAFGQQIAEVCDYAILVGSKRTEPIRSGLDHAGFPHSQVHIAADLKAASAHLREIVGRDDVVLFENDLPDNYDEVASKQ